VHVQQGNYSYYLEKRRERELREKAWSTAEPVKTAAASGSKPKPRKLSFNEARELETIEADILAAEEKVQSLDGTLNDPGFYINRSAEAPALMAELEAAKAEVTRLYARWEELEAIKAAQPAS